MRWLLRTPGAAKEAEGEAAGGRRKRRAGAPKHRPREDPAETRDGQGALRHDYSLYRFPTRMPL